MDFGELERLVDIVQNANIRGLTLRQGTSRVTIRKSVRPALDSGSLVSATQEDWENADAVISELTEGPSNVEDDGRTVVVAAPAVGIFRHVKPLVGLLASVKPGQLMGQIEAPRLVNEVTAPVAGIVTDVCTEDGMPVEYGQPLFVLEVERPVD